MSKDGEKRGSFLMGLVWGLAVGAFGAAVAAVVFPFDPGKRQASLSAAPEPAAEIAQPAAPEADGTEPQTAALASGGDAAPVAPEAGQAAPEVALGGTGSEGEAGAAPTIDTSPAAMPEAETGTVAPPGGPASATGDVTVAENTPSDAQATQTAQTMEAIEAEQAAEPETAQTMEAMEAGQAAEPQAAQTMEAMEADQAAEPETAQTMEAIEAGQAVEPEAAGTEMAAAEPAEATAAPQPEPDAQPQAAAAPAAEAEPAPEPAGPVVLPEADLKQGAALALNRAIFEDPGDRALMAVVLEDVGAGGLARDSLTGLGAPITFAVSADDPDAAAAAKTFRGKGFEVAVMPPAEGPQALTTGLEADVLRADLGAIFAAVPQAAILLDRPEGILPRDSTLAREVIDALAVTGHGLVTHRGAGLNTVDRLAEGTSVKTGMVFRSIDDRAGAGNIAAALDRAALEASKTGGIIVYGTTREETVKTLFTWILGSNSKSVRIAPASAVIAPLF